MRLVFLGPPGVGKGTQARKLSAAKKLPHVATGDMLREAIKTLSGAGLKAQTLMEKGDLVPDHIVIEIVEERFSKGDMKGGFILDGFPRTIPQAEALAAILAKQRATLGRVLYFEAPDTVLVARISGRRTCKKCQANFHVTFVPPKRAGVCDHCGGELFQRRDDAEETVRERLRVYKEQTRELVGYYTERKLLVRIAASQPPDKVFAELMRAIG